MAGLIPVKMIIHLYVKSSFSHVDAACSCQRYGICLKIRQLEENWWQLTLAKLCGQFPFVTSSKTWSLPDKNSEKEESNYIVRIIL